MSITTDNVRHLAKLASLAIPDADLPAVAKQLDAIVAYVDQLAQVDTTGVEPLANVSGAVNVTRPDEAHGLLASKDVLGNAPQRNDVAFLVPKVVER